MSVAGVQRTDARHVAEIDRVRKQFVTQAGERVVALAETTLTLAEGEFVAVIGPSGCGKTTLLKILAGIHQASSGTIKIAGGNTSQEPSVGIVFQTPILMPWLKLIENVLLPASVRPLDMPLARRRAHELLDLVGLSGFENKYPGEMSGGMQQRAALVRALVTDPPVLLMDEPFGALDALTRERMNVELQRIWMTTRKTIFFITHGISEAVFLADRVLVMSSRPGRVVADLHVSFERPRPIEIMNTEAFGELASHIRGLLDEGRQ